MKRLLIILLSALSLMANAESVKLALLQPLTVPGSTACNAMEVSMVRGELRKALGWQSNFQVLTRMDVDAMLNEMGFQQSGMVDDAQRKKIGVMTSAQYICVSSITKYGTQLYIEAYLVNVETGQMTNPATQYVNVKNEDYSTLPIACGQLAKEMQGEISGSPVKSPIGNSGVSTRQLAKKDFTEDTKLSKGIFAEQAEATEEQARMRALISKSWDILLNERITDENHRGDDRCLIGDLYGKGIELFFNGNLHCGDYKGGDWVGRGIYICQDKTYVGEFKTAYSWGTGSLYDKNGKLTHYGKFVGIKPQKVLYREDGYNYTFGVINYKNGDKYVGELRNGIRHGKGLYIYAKGDGVAWYGEWKEGIRNGEGIFFYDGGAKYSTGIWKGDTQL